MVHSNDFAERHGFFQLALAFLFVGAVNTVVFVVSNLYIKSQATALLVVIIIMSLVTVACIVKGWQTNASLFWQYSASQFLVAGLVLSSMGVKYVSHTFYWSAIIYGLAALVLIGLNLSDRNLLKVHGASYILLHILTAAAAFSIAYLKYS